MSKMTKADVIRMIKKDADHMIFDGVNYLTKRLPIQQIEAIFPDSLLILTDITYDTDSEGNLVIVDAVVDRFCETTKEASDYINENFSSLVESGTPYHTGVTKYNHEKYFECSKKSNFSREVTKRSESYVKQMDSELPFGAISTAHEKYCSIKDFDWTLPKFFEGLNLPEQVYLDLLHNIRVATCSIPAPDFDYDTYVRIIYNNLSKLGYQPTDHFKERFEKYLEENYPRLISRNRVVIFYKNAEDKDILKEYCENKQYEYVCMRSDRFNELLSMMLQDKLKKIVVIDTTMENLSVVKTKVLGMMAVKCEMRIEVISS